MYSIKNISYLMLACFSVSLLVACNTTLDGVDEEEEGLSVSRIIKDIVDYSKTSAQNKRVIDEDIDINTQAQKIDEAIKVIEAHINEKTAKMDQESQVEAIKKVKQSIETYKQSDEGQDNQFAWEFSRSVVQQNFNSMPDKEILSSMDKIAIGLKRAKKIIAKGLSFAGNIGGIVLNIIETFAKNNPNIDKNALGIADDFFGKEGHLNKIASSLQEVYPNRPIAKEINKEVDKSSNKSKSKEPIIVPEVAPNSQMKNPNANPMNQIDSVQVVRALLNEIQMKIIGDKKIMKFLNSSIPDKQKAIAKMDVLAKKGIEIEAKKEQPKSKKTDKKPSKKASQAEKKLNNKIKEIEMIEEIKACTKKPEFQFFCEETK